jgi:hypothetical protein
LVATARDIGVDVDDEHVTCVQEEPIPGQVASTSPNRLLAPGIHPSPSGAGAAEGDRSFRLQLGENERATAQHRLERRLDHHFIGGTFCHESNS